MYACFYNKILIYFRHGGYTNKHFLSLRHPYHWIISDLRKSDEK